MKVLIIGATGLIGCELVKSLDNCDEISNIILLTRRPIEVESKKSKIEVIDFDRLNDYKSKVKGDVLFSCLGTTIKKARTKKKFYDIDFGYQYGVAKIAAENNVKKLVLVSSVGADEKSKSFYLKTKGQLEIAVSKLEFESISILRPSILLGNRNESRPIEKLSISILKPFTPLFKYIPKYKPVSSKDVASAMRNFAIKRATNKLNFYEGNALFESAKS